MKLWRWWWKNILGIVGPPRCYDAFAVVTRLLVVCLVITRFEGCDGHNMCASTATHRAPWRADTNNDLETNILDVGGGQQEPIHRDMNKSADVVCFVKRMV